MRDETEPWRILRGLLEEAVGVETLEGGAYDGSSSLDAIVPSHPVGVLAHDAETTRHEELNGGHRLTVALARNNDGDPNPLRYPRGG